MQRVFLLSGKSVAPLQHVFLLSGKPITRVSEPFTNKNELVTLIFYKTMITSIELRNLRNAEFVQFQKDFAAIITRNNPEALQIQAKAEALNAKNVELDTLFKKILANENTKVLVDLDTRRDNALNGIMYHATSYTYHFNSTLKTAGQRVLENINHYGSGIARLNYQAETATLNSIITDWETKPELTEAITTLNLTAWKTELKEANTAFSQTYLDRTQEYGNANPENLKTKREETNTAYYGLRDRINALHLLAETTPSPYATLINQLNALIDQYNSLLNGRANTPEVNG